MEADYDSWRDTPHPMAETWALEWANAIYLGTDQTWIQRIELARLVLRERAASVRAAEETKRVVEAARRVGAAQPSTREYLDALGDLRIALKALGAESAHD